MHPLLLTYTSVNLVSNLTLTRGITTLEVINRGAEAGRKNVSISRK